MFVESAHRFATSKARPWCPHVIAGAKFHFTTRSNNGPVITQTSGHVRCGPLSEKCGIPAFSLSLPGLRCIPGWLQSLVSIATTNDNQGPQRKDHIFDRSCSCLPGKDYPNGDVRKLVHFQDLCGYATESRVHVAQFQRQSRSTHSGGKHGRHSRVCLWSEAAMTKTPGGRAAITWAGNEVFRWKLGKEWRVDCRRDMLSKRFLVFILQSTDSRDKAISSKTDYNARSQVCHCRNNPWQQDTSHKKYTHTLHITVLIVLENLINITKCDDGFWFCMKPMEIHMFIRSS